MTQLEVSGRLNGYAVTLAIENPDDIGRCARQLVAQLAEAGISPVDGNSADMSEADNQQGWYAVSELRLLYTPSGNPYVLAKGLSEGEPFPNLQKHGVMCWPEVYESVLGNAEQLKVTPGVGEPIPVPPTASRMLVQFKPNKSNGMSPNRVVRFA